MTDKTSELLPCAHCGSEPMRRKMTDKATMITCSQCAISTGLELHENAPNVWNTRTTEAKLEKALAFIKDLRDELLADDDCDCKGIEARELLKELE